MFYDLRKIYEGAHNTERRPDTTGWKCPECGKEIPGEAAIIIGLLEYNPSRWYAAEVIGAVACPACAAQYRKNAYVLSDSGDEDPGHLRQMRLEEAMRQVESDLKKIMTGGDDK